MAILLFGFVSSRDGRRETTVQNAGLWQWIKGKVFGSNDNDDLADQGPPGSSNRLDEVDYEYSDDALGGHQFYPGMHHVYDTYDDDSEYSDHEELW